jgi:hypothetical protein
MDMIENTIICIDNNVSKKPAKTINQLKNSLKNGTDPY